ncbi:hypothetical protein Pfo_025593 [Paulownia fortunei]|nr:hypothetical protein Pfo_025593 [Paulownia fortunei]
MPPISPSILSFTLVNCLAKNPCYPSPSKRLARLSIRGIFLFTLPSRRISKRAVFQQLYQMRIPPEPSSPTAKKSSPATHMPVGLYGTHFFSILIYNRSPRRFSSITVPATVAIIVKLPSELGIG